jgi:recombinational DNA repair protein (RecF pathway)
MKLIKTNGVVIAEKMVGDFDKIVTILTPNVR